MNDLKKTLREYLHGLSDTDLSLEEIKVALLMGIWKAVRPIQEIDLTHEDIERRIKELKDNSKCYGSDAEIKVDSYRRCSGAKEMFRVSAKRMSYNEYSDGKYIGLVDVPMEDKDDAIEYLATIKQGIMEYAKGGKRNEQTGNDNVLCNYGREQTL